MYKLADPVEEFSSNCFKKWMTISDRDHPQLPVPTPLRDIFLGSNSFSLEQTRYRVKIFNVWPR